MDNADSSTPPFPAFDHEMAEILESFLVETREILEKLSKDLLLLEKGNSGSELLNSIFRAVHTVKGTSSFLGLDQMTELAHSFEDVLNRLRRGELEMTPGKMDVMLAAFDQLKNLLIKIENRDGTRVDLQQILARLQEVARTTRSGVGEPTKAVPETTGTPSSLPLETAVPQPTTDGAISVPETLEQRTGGLTVQKEAAESTIRVEVTRLDSLMNLVGELVLGRNRLTQISSQLAQEHEGLSLSRVLADTSAQIDFITTELQMAVMKTRMVPIAKVFNKMPRLIRDLCRETGKEIELQLDGEETELDKSIIDELNDPLIHIIRNAADHGIESQKDRIAAGKSALGVVRVVAVHEGNNIVVSIKDDGRGMDPEKLKAKAQEKGLITAVQAKEMSPREALNLVFVPGFSTATVVTNISGRGVGMDVVRTNISKLKGIVEIESEKGVGTTFIIKLPLTLAIIQALLVKAVGEIFCIPLNSVLEVVRVCVDEISTINGKEVVRLRNSILPIVRIASLLGARDNGKMAEWTYIVVVGLAEQRLGVVVDSMLGQKEVVIKSLGNYLGKVMGIAGSTILGDGQVIMIVDVAEMMKVHVTQL